MKSRGNVKTERSYLTEVIVVILLIVFFATVIPKITNNPGNDGYIPPSADNNSNYEGGEIDKDGNIIGKDDSPSIVIKEEDDNQFVDNQVVNKEFSLNDSDLLKVHFLNVGQADSIFIEVDNKAILIDAGNGPDGKHVAQFIQSRGYNKIDIAIGTHPHEDHIGGFKDLVSLIDIGDIYMPRVKDEHLDKLRNLAVFEAIDENGYKLTSPRLGDVLYSSETAKLTVINDTSKATNFNDYSISTKLDFKDVSFVFTGDLEKGGEARLIEEFGKGNLKADVYKSGHHGSTTSNTPELLNAMKPKYSVIQVGEGNRYGHPHDEIIRRFKDNNIEYTRTDKDGTITFFSNGFDLKYETQVTKGGSKEEELGKKWNGDISLPEKVIFD